MPSLINVTKTFPLSQYLEEESLYGEDLEICDTSNVNSNFFLSTNMIQTKTGAKRMVDVIIGDSIFYVKNSNLELTCVTNVLTHFVSPDNLVQLETTGKVKTFIISKNNKYAVQGKGFIEVENLKKDDILLSSAVESIKVISVKPLTLRLKTVIQYNFDNRKLSTDKVSVVNIVTEGGAFLVSDLQVQG